MALNQQLTSFEDTESGREWLQTSLYGSVCRALMYGSHIYSSYVHLMGSKMKRGGGKYNKKTTAENIKIIREINKGNGKTEI